jgi:hypothetical protein
VPVYSYTATGRLWDGGQQRKFCPNCGSLVDGPPPPDAALPPDMFDAVRRNVVPGGDLPPAHLSRRAWHLLSLLHERMGRRPTSVQALMMLMYCEEGGPPSGIIYVFVAHVRAALRGTPYSIHAVHRVASIAKLAFVGLQQRLLSSIAAFARTLKVHRATLKRVLDGEEAARVAAAAQAFVEGPRSEDSAELGLEDESAERAIDADDNATAEAASALGVAGAAKDDLRAELAAVDEMLALAEGTPPGPMRGWIGWWTGSKGTCLPGRTGTGGASSSSRNTRIQGAGSNDGCVRLWQGRIAPTNASGCSRERRDRIEGKRSNGPSTPARRDDARAYRPALRR